MNIRLTSDIAPLATLKSTDKSDALCRHFGFQFPSKIRAKYESGATNLFHLARTVFDEVADDAEFKFVKLDTSVWRSGENIDLIETVFRRHGIEYDQIVRRVLVGKRSCAVQFRTLLHVSLLFGWDAAFLSASALILVEHDGWVELSMRNPASDSLLELGFSPLET